MILIDFNQFVLATLFVKYKIVNEATPVDVQNIYDIVESNIYNYRRKFGNCGEVVICSDNDSYWRSDVFEYYKGNRKNDRKKSSNDWDRIFKIIYEVESQLRGNSDFRLLNIPGCEADDIIGTLCLNFPYEKHIIVSTDKDFLQLHENPNIKQYCPRKKQFLAIDNPGKYLVEHVITGDRDDGIPNIFSPPNALVDGIRQTAIRRDKLANWLENDDYTFLDDNTVMAAYQRNWQLINLEEIPLEITTRIMETFDDI